MAEPVNFDYNPVTNELDMVGGGGPVPISEHQGIITNGVQGVFNDQNRTNTTNAFGQCHTASNNPAKTAVLVSAASVLLTQGLTVRVGFDNANTADNPTLAINGGWGLYIYVNGAQITTGDNKGLLCGVCEFVCDGSKWHLIGSQPKIDPALMTNVTYAELVALRSNAGLKPGEYYRITDYACTTTQPFTRSAGNAFDIIVRADAVDKLNENAFAAHHSGDTYFAYCNLAAWSLKYTLDNDVDRFAWADAINGKGVIYYMRDEFNNECPYDFKNIQFQRWSVDALSGPSEDALKVDGSGNSYNLFYGIKTLEATAVPSGATLTTGNDGWFYTFALKDLEDDAWYDYTVIINTYPLKNTEGYLVSCYDNHIAPAAGFDIDRFSQASKILNNIVFFNVCDSLSDTTQDHVTCCYANRFAENCHNNSLGCSFSCNTIGASFMNNCLGNYFIGNCTGTSFMNNSVGNYFKNSCIGASFMDNCVGNYFRYITVSEGVGRCDIWGGNNLNSFVDNVLILNGTSGNVNRLQIAFGTNLSVTQVAGLADDGTLNIWQPAAKPEQVVSTATAQLSLANNKIFNCGVMTAVEVTLPSGADSSFISQLNFTSGSTPTQFRAPNNIMWSGDDVASTLVPVANTRYVVMFYFDGLYWRAISQAVEYTAPVNQ